MRKATWKFTLLVPAIALASACLPHGKRSLEGRGGGGSLVAAIDGIDVADRGRAGVGYWLNCDTAGVRLKGTPVGEEQDAKIQFTGTGQVGAEDRCWLEVRISLEEANKLPWDWFGIKQDKSKDVGLMYGSTEDVVGDDRALNLTVYKLYAKQAAKPFSIDVRAKFEVPEGTTAPDAAAVKGVLVCDGADHPGDYKAAAEAATGVFSFANLDVSKLIGKSCTELKALVDNKLAYQAKALDWSLAAAKAGETLSFPESVDNHVILKPIGDLEVGTVDGGVCLEFASGKCLDKREPVALPWDKNFVLVRVKGKRGDAAEPVTFLAGAGAGIGLLEKTAVTLDDLNAAVADQKLYTFYRHSDDLQKRLLSADFGSELISGALAAPDKASAADLAGVRLLHIDAVWVHGFHEVQPDVLNKRANALWLAKIVATKGQAKAEFVVGGKDNYFYSPAAPIQAAKGNRYFDFAQLVAEAEQGFFDKWSVYAYKGQAMASVGCEMVAKDYIFGQSLKNLGEMRPANATDAKLEACRVAAGGFDVALKDAEIKANYYAWEWFRLP